MLRNTTKEIWCTTKISFDDLHLYLNNGTTLEHGNKYALTVGQKQDLSGLLGEAPFSIVHQMPPNLESLDRWVGGFQTL